MQAASRELDQEAGDVRGRQRCAGRNGVQDEPDRPPPPADQDPDSIMTGFQLDLRQPVGEIDVGEQIAHEGLDGRFAMVGCQAPDTAPKAAARPWPFAGTRAHPGPFDSI